MISQSRVALLAVLLLHHVVAHAPPTQVLFQKGAEGIYCYRIPILLSLGSTGPLLAFAEARHYTCSDIGSKKIAYRRSVDGGHSWSNPSFIYDDGLPKNATRGLNLGMATFDAVTQEVFLNFGECVHLQGCHASVMQLRSKDLGLSFEPVERVQGIVQEPEVSAFKYGEGSGIQLRSGRLLVCGRFNSKNCGKSTGKGDANCGSRCSISDNHGKSWRLAIGSVPSAPGKVSPSECQAAELINGSVLLNMRDEERSHLRLLARSDDGGETWTPPWHQADLVDATCQGSIVSAAGQLYTSNAFSAAKRANLTISTSADEGSTWNQVALITEGRSAYSAISYVEVNRDINLEPRCLAFAYEAAFGSVRAGRCCSACGFNERDFAEAGGSVLI